MLETITSFQNPRVKLIKKLRDKKGRQQENRFVIDDVRDLERAQAQGYSIDFLLYCPALETGRGVFQVNEWIPTPSIFEVSREIMEKVSYREHPGAWAAVLHAKPVKTEAHLGEIVQPLVLVLVNLQKPGNIGALLRSADATGFRAVLLVDTALDLYNPNIIRSSTGACFLDNVYFVRSAAALTFLKSAGYAVLSAALDGRVSLFDVRFDRKTAVVLGTEDRGLEAIWRDQCDQQVKIPMVATVVDSLNVSAAGTIFMVEALRQKSISSV